MPRTSWFAVSELVLLALLAWQVARLVWTVATPVDPLGAWLPGGEGAGTRVAALGGFDPFFRLAPDPGVQAVTAMNLKLYGVRADQATGRGSAIIALPDGTQQSFAVGDEVIPGVRLDAVRIDGVTLLRGGAREQLFIDQSAPTGEVPPAPPPPVAPEASAAPATPADEIAVSPRIANGAVTGVTLQPRGAGTAFRAAGLQPGDVLVGVNGKAIAEADVAGLQGLLASGQSATLQVERGGRAMTLTAAGAAPR